ncbi:MAG: hypothetical protein MEQ84_08480 [Mesorhizobium sp.]|nr:hypothetical protein [Mesorhizobium sp.]
MDSIEQALADGEALLRELERNERERENRRRTMKCFTVADGRGGFNSFSVPRHRVEG